MLDTNNSYLRYKYIQHERKGQKWFPVNYGSDRYMNLKKFKKKRNPVVIKDKVGECAGLMKSMHYADTIAVFIPRMAVKSEEFLIEWIEFVNKLGYPCHYMGKSPVKMDKKKMYVVYIYPYEYPPKGKHLLAVHTLIRYSYSYRYRQISKHALKIYDLTDLNKWKSLYLAHYAPNKKYKGYYGLLPDEDVKGKDRGGKKRFVFPPDPVGIKEWLHKEKINQSFGNEIKKELPKYKFCPKNYHRFIKALKL